MNTKKGPGSKAGKPVLIKKKLARRELMKGFGERFRQLRKQAGYTQQALSDLAGYDRTYISGIEGGKRNPSVSVLLDIAQCMNIPATKFLEGMPQKK